MKRGKILVIRGGAIGDFILTLPVLAALRRQFPDTQLDVLGYPHIAQLARAGGLVDEVRSIEARALAGFFARGGSLDPALAEYFEGCSVIFSYLFDPDGIFQENVARCSKAQFIAGPHRPDETQNLHATETFLKPLERLAIFEADSVPRLLLGGTGSTPSVNITEVVSTAVAQTAPAAWLAVHPGSGSELKNWPEPHWAALLARVSRETTLRCLLAGGEAEGQRLERLAAALPSDRVEVVCRLPLPDLAVRLQSCAAFVGHDSGITHLAAAVGLPCLVLWGPTREQIWRPRGERIQLLRHRAGLAALAVADVFAGLNQWLATPKNF